MIVTGACHFSSSLSVASSSSAAVSVAVASFNVVSLSSNPNIIPLFPVIHSSNFRSFSLIRHRNSSTRRFLHRFSFHTENPFSSQSSTRAFTPNSPAERSGTFVEHVADITESAEGRSELYDFGDVETARNDVRYVATRRVETEVEVRELEELPEEWRRSKLAWLCKEVPSHKSVTLVRLLNGQNKWVRQEDATYIAVNCMRIRENETGFE